MTILGFDFFGVMVGRVILPVPYFRIWPPKRFTRKSGVWQPPGAQVERLANCRENCQPYTTYCFLTMNLTVFTIFLSLYLSTIVSLLCHSTAKNHWFFKGCLARWTMLRNQIIIGEGKTRRERKPSTQSPKKSTLPRNDGKSDRNCRQD